MERVWGQTRSVSIETLASGVAGALGTVTTKCMKVRHELEITDCMAFIRLERPSVTLEARGQRHAFLHKRSGETVLHVR
jgi:hypothetical protein